jgi:hypothetical protein
MLCIDESCTGYGRVMSKCKVSTVSCIADLSKSVFIAWNYIRRDIPWQLWQLVSDKGSCIRDGHRLDALLCKKVSCDKYFLLLHRMPLSCTGWLVSRNSRGDSRDENIRILLKTQRHSWPYFHWSVTCFVYSKPWSNFHCIDHYRK